MRSEALETTGQDGLSLRVEFLWHVDRYRHVVSVIQPSGLSIPLLESIEGSPVDDWPPSPPLQNLHLDAQPGGRRVGLLVGMSGQSHWSASIGPTTNGTGLVFDVACRAGRSPGRLLTTYRIAREVRPSAADAAVLRLECSNWSATVAVSTDSATLTELRTLDTELAISPCPSGLAIPPTRRWLYRIDGARAGSSTRY
jgi:hypothetical protein